MLPEELIIEILTHVDSAKDIIKLELTNKYFHSLIRKTRWTHTPFKIKHMKYYDYVINNYKIGYWDFSWKQLTNEQIALLNHCHILNIMGCDTLSDQSIPDLKKHGTVIISGSKSATLGNSRYGNTLRRAKIFGYTSLSDHGVEILRSNGVNIITSYLYPNK
jgi:hypothetical protein